MPRASWVKMGTMDYGYMWDIQSPAELSDYLENVHAAIVQAGAWEILRLTKSNVPLDHACQGIASAVGALQQVRPNLSAVECLGQLSLDISEGMLRCLRETKRIFVNANGGYFTPSKDVEVFSTVKTRKWVLPDDKKIRITQWPDGRHFYAKVGQQEVELDGKRKWSSEAGARRAALEFMAREGM